MSGAIDHTVMKDESPWTFRELQSHPGISGAADAHLSTCLVTLA